MNATQFRGTDFIPVIGFLNYERRCLNSRVNAFFKDVRGNTSPGSGAPGPNETETQRDYAVRATGLLCYNLAVISGTVAGIAKLLN